MGNDRAAAVLDTEDEASFYGILGVSPVADARTIRSAYLNLMRQTHPDATGDAGTGHLAALLNEIYETLSDGEARATYDALAGFADGGANPFTSPGEFPADRLFVDELTCIGCGKCARSCAAAFEMEPGLAGRARVARQPNVDVDAEVDAVAIAIESCPVDCIHWVTAPQLALLEVVLGTMPRVDAFVMMRGFRRPGDVFATASRHWSKRQATLAERRRRYTESGAQGGAAHRAAGAGAAAGEEAQGWAGFWRGWQFASAHVEFKDGASSEGGGQQRTASGGGRGVSDRDGRRIADLAASAARSLRLWRMQMQVTAEVRALSD